jgi:hypothetical protein
MKTALQIGAYVVGLLLEVRVVDAMRRGPYRQYPFLFLYVIADFITTVLEIEPGLASSNGTKADIHRWKVLYWIDEQIIQALLFLLVISLLYRASAQTRQRRPLLLGLIGATLVFATGSLLVHYSPDIKTGEWMTPWTRDLYFCAAVLDLGLWAMLIRSREKDYQLLMLSGALGIKCAGDAMGHAFTQIAPAMVSVSGVLIILANLTCTYIWWQAFRPPNRPKDMLPKGQAAA